MKRATIRIDGSLMQVNPLVADEIERLRTDLGEIQQYAANHMRHTAGQPHGPLATIVDMTRATLSLIPEQEKSDA